MKLAAVALVLSALALGASVVAWRRDDPQPQRSAPRNDRIAVLEARIDALTREVEALRAPAGRNAAPDARALPLVPQPAAHAAVEVEEGEAPKERSDTLEAIVDEAVERKTERVLDEMRVKENKKPEIGVFAAVLELSPGQREAAERVIVDGQTRIHRILGTATLDGTNLMDELVEIAARGIAEPGKDHGFGRWIGRLLTEPIPGSNETYATRIEAVKNEMRTTFRREWSEAQYREFESWGLDPSEVQKVPGSPNEALGERIAERARALGAEPPEGD